MTAWVVRAGRLGEQEHWNLEHGRVTVGWSEIGDLSTCHSREDMRARVDAAYPDGQAQSHAIQAGQLWAFRDLIKPGDLVVMPLKSRRGYLQLGRVTGGYHYDAAQPDRERRHYIPVEWIGDPVSKTVLGGDLVATLNSIMTVFKPTRNGAADRLESVAATGVDPRVSSESEQPSGTTEVTAEESAQDVADPEVVPTTVAIRDRISAYVAQEFREHRLTHLVAEILTAMGFQCEVSPPGPDGGVDIVAGMGPLGLDAPTVIVEVKSERTAIDVKVVRGLHSAMMQHKADQALLVAWGGVTKPARAEFQRDRTSLRVWDADALLDKLFETYDRLPASTRLAIPLKQVWVLDKDE